MTKQKAILSVKVAGRGDSLSTSDADDKNDKEEKKKVCVISKFLQLFSQVTHVIILNLQEVKTPNSV